MTRDKGARRATTLLGEFISPLSLSPHRVFAVEASAEGELQFTGARGTE